MTEYKLFDAEHRLLDIIWEREPVNSTDLCRVCAERLGWKKSTTYTMIRKLCGRGILASENATVTALVTRRQIQKYEGEALLEKSFDGSLPAFLATFLHGRKLTEAEAREMKRLIEEAQK